MSDQPTILVADDSATVRHLIARILERAGYRVLEAADGLDALMVILTERPDVAVLDLEMPGCTGIEVLRRIRQVPDLAEVAVLVLTAGGDRATAAAALAEGAEDFLRKPCDPGELVARVRKAVKTRDRLADLDRRSSTDPLTGLANRRGMEPVLAALEGPARAGTGLYVVDIDHFKDVNDTWGHDVGDVVLRTVAGRLAATASPLTVARWGGEEFVAAGRCDGVVDLERAGERMRRAICAVPCEIDVDDELRSVPITVSIGAVLVPEGTSLRTAMADADAALYEAKAWGRNQVVVAVEGRLEPVGGRRSEPAAPSVPEVATLERFLRD